MCGEVTGKAIDCAQAKASERPFIHRETLVPEGARYGSKASG
jgi:hypothetical protein